MEKRLYNSDRVDILHYRAYEQDAYDSDKFKLLAYGGFTLAVKWPTKRDPLFECGVSRCSFKDHFTRRTGFIKALGRLSSSGKFQRVVTDDDQWWDYAKDTFETKCLALTMALRGDIWPVDPPCGNFSNYVFMHRRWLCGEDVPSAVFVRSSTLIYDCRVKSIPWDIWTGIWTKDVADYIESF